MRFFVPLIVSLLVLPFSPDRPAAAAPMLGAGTVTITMGPGRDGSQLGTATLTAKGAQTEVVINIQPGAAGVAQPAHIHVGGCPGVGAVVYPLTFPVDGKSTSLVNASLGSLLGGGHSINVHESAARSAIYTSCGNLVLANMPSVTVEMGAGRDASQLGSATLTAQGNQTVITLNIQPGPAGTQQPAHVHEGGCPGVGAVKYPLTNVVNGMSTTTVNAPIAELFNGMFSINAHRSAAEIGIYTSCGNLSLTGAAGGALAPQAPAQPVGKTVNIQMGAFDYWFEPGNIGITAGDKIAFTLTNRGASTHNVRIEGSGLQFQSPNITGGQSVTFEVTFTQPGLYAFWCDIGAGAPTHHRLRGEEGTINVSAAPPDAPSVQTRSLDLVPLRGSGVGGQAVLQPRADGQVAVQLRPTGLTVGTGYFASAHNAASSNCVGGVSGSGLAGPARAGAGYGLVMAGPVDSIAGASLSEGQPPPTAAQLRACADVRGVTATLMPATGNAGLASEAAGDPVAAAAALLGGGILVGALVYARRRAR